MTITHMPAGVQPGKKVFIRLPEVLKRTGLIKRTWYRRIAVGRAPEGTRLGGKAVGWLEGDIDSLLEAWARNETPRYERKRGAR